MKKISTSILLLAVAIFLTQCDVFDPSEKETETLDPQLIEEGREIFRYDTFGDEAFWSGILHIDKAILGKDNGGYGPGVSPNTALSVGLKVDSEALPPELVAAINAGKVDLDDPATTVALLKLDAVVGVKGTFSEQGEMTKLGITCAVCHSSVDNSFAAGIGKRLDGWPNRDLNVGAIISLTDNAQPVADLLHVDESTLRTVLSSWGPGKFNAGLMVDGIALRPDGSVAANLLPAAYGLTKESRATYTGWGDVSYWNAFVANIEMHGIGNFNDPRLNNSEQFPIATENQFYDIQNDEDLITSKLPALLEYQVSLDTPVPPEGSFDVQAAKRGKGLFIGKADCASCHTGPTFSDSERRLHSPEEIGIDSFEADRSPTGMYRTTPLRGVWARSNGGYYHDGRFTDLLEVVDHYNNHFDLNLSAKEKSDLVEYLKSL
ncbi:hypothetical protein NC796_02310 [Aliifodinibius sp. S!AR15-10]|uniref:hypothetical protein n=1 Tax=Aliifodinibius sp. S!AR15-10 TaxID=2950437 RepID=UPI00285E8B28|nr:hypothetical protein [Aliifodinibius sp. S!AR15-10]MDR8389954.1 hypothetical protein [Aliifodinibius sp. S!AR15-10]